MQARARARSPRRICARPRRARKPCGVIGPWARRPRPVGALRSTYPKLSAPGRDRLLGWIERTLEAPRLDPATADEVAP
jgi:hypothetical protein